MYYMDLALLKLSSDGNCSTPLEVACENGYDNIIQLLLKKNDLFVTNNQDNV